MIRHDMPQGSRAWLQARLGIPTASNFDQIITPTGKASGSWEKYGNRLLAERLLGTPVDDASSGFMERGSLMEQDAIDFYEMQRECDTEAVGFLLRDDRRVGCSPDRLVGADGLLEIKCPSAPQHVGYLLDAKGIGYKVQVQGQLWIAEREWSDTLSYHPSLPPALVRVGRDEAFIAKLASEINRFLTYLEESMEKLQRRGVLAEAGTLPIEEE